MQTRFDLPPLLLCCDAARLLRREINERNRDLGLSEPQWRVVGVVRSLPGVRQRDLGLILGLGKSPLAERVERLVSGGWLLQRVDREDRRNRRLELTARGRAAAIQLRARYLALCEELVRHTGAAGWAELERALVALAQAHAGEELNAALAPMATQGQLHLLAVLCRQLQPGLREVDLNHNQWLMLALLGPGGRRSQRDLGPALGLDKVSVARNLASLDERGWLQRTVDGQDRRLRQVALSPAGQRRWRQLEGHADQWLQQWLEPLTVALHRPLIRGLQAIHGHLLNLAAVTATVDETKADDDVPE